MLYIIPSPIGNLKDITFRAIEVLKDVDVILAEDTRNTARLLNHYQVNRPLSPYHQHNEHKVVQHLVDQLQAGKKMAVVTDAGTPGISDPAFLLVRECIKAGVRVECLPGPTAFVPALLKSGLGADRFVFEGFLPQKKGRLTILKSLAAEQRTMIFYESPFRLLKTLGQFAEHFGVTRRASVSRELTKRFEETVNGTLGDIIAYFTDKEAKGEIVIVVAGSGDRKSMAETDTDEVLQ